MSGFPDVPATSGAAPAKVPFAVEVTLPDRRKRFVQVNFCKNPRCENFGVSAVLPRYARRAKAAGAAGSAHTIAALGKDLSVVR